MQRAFLRVAFSKHLNRFLDGIMGNSFIIVAVLWTQGTCLRRTGVL